MSEKWMLKADAGAVGNGITDDTVAWDNWLVHGFMTGQPLGIEPGRYEITSTQTINLNNYTGMPGGGLDIIGAGKGRSIFDFKSVSGGTPCTFESSAQANMFFRLKGFTIETDFAGVGFRVGKQNYTDSFDSGELDISVSNINTSSSACAIELNFLTDFDFNILAQNGGHGDAIRMRQVQMSRGKISGGNADIGLHLTAGYNGLGNVFDAIDLENCGICIQGDSASNSNNIFNGGQLNYNSYGVNFTAGGSYYMIKPNFAPNSGASGSIQCSVGLTVI